MNQPIEQRHRDAAIAICDLAWDIHLTGFELQPSALLDLLANDFPSQSWVAVTPETMPLNCEPVLLLKEGSVEEGHWNADGPEGYHWWADASDDWYADDIVTHWMPKPSLPLPPEMRDGGA